MATLIKSLQVAGIVLTLFGLFWVETLARAWIRPFDWALFSLILGPMMVGVSLCIVAVILEEYAKKEAV